MTVDDLDTPALTVDLAILEKNIRNAADSCRKHDINLRAHIKTHKIPEIAHMQLEAGAIGIVCQKLGEAEVMCATGIRDILIPYNIVGKGKLERLTRLLRRAIVTVAVDSEDASLGISRQAQMDNCKVRVIIELDTGGKRCGVQSPEAALKLAKRIVKMPGLDFQGIMTYPSTIEAETFIRRTVELLEAENIPVNIISGGGTGTEAVSKEIGCTETRMGSYAFEGMTRVGHGTLNPETCAMRMIVTVVSTPAPDRIIIDGGEKTFTSYPPTPYGYVMEYPELEIYAMSVEHGHLNTSKCSNRFKVGERLSVIPTHQGMTTNLHDEVVAVRNGKVEVIWKVEARGKVR